ncbi:MAG TPA: tRNA (N(6)-L-threonylcarbamoyladenosine(37)-C(2))-methylthiotransferase MtaB [bacterium]|nr:tRNA (N(6)-L-threonylcarbamoyladenosine(37)-C(2))-methylthiotransferase MtaB [bacterium]
MFDAKRSLFACYKTFGCKVNQYETEKLAEILETYKIYQTLKIEDAEILIINSCAVTETALIKLKKYINRCKSQNPNIRIILIGCAVDYLEKQNNKLNNVNATIKNSDKFDIPKILANIAKIECSDTMPNSKTINKFTGHSRAFVKIQDGCDNFCSYCIIPLLRSKLESRNIKEIIEEIEKLIASGYYEIILTGINIQKYNFDGYNLARLLKQICKLPFDFRLRLSSINVKAIDGEFLDVFANKKKICKHLHISLQSGSDKILKLMNRNYTAFEYLDKIEKLKKIRENIGITTDVIVGFPSETDEDFQKTINILKKAKTSKTHIFPYSNKTNTAACIMQNKISENIKKQRVEILKKICGELTDNFVNKNINKIFRIAPEPEKNQIFGYTENYIRGYFNQTTVKKNNLKKYYDAKIINYDSALKLALFDTKIM